jgi:itaconate CoA-transferase
VWVNRSKESVTLDLKQPDALAALKELIATADVLVQNLAPGAAARMGLSYEALSASNPGLIVCDISGYGADGPYRDKKAYDLLIQSEAGFLSVTGTPDEPCKSGNSIADIAAGMYGYTSVLAALLQRGKTGKGSHIDVSMLESLGEWMGFPMYYAYEGAPPPPRSAASHATIYPYGPFAAGDGGTVMLGLQNEREWKIFCDKVLLQSSLATDPRFDANAKRNTHRAELKAIILQAFGEMTAAQVVQRLDDAGIANARMNSMAEMWAHPQLHARGRVQQVASPAGDIAALLPPGVNSAVLITVWMRYPRSASTPMLFCESWVAPRRTLQRCARRAPSDSFLEPTDGRIDMSTAQLAAFAANLKFEDIPDTVVCKAEDLLVDWFGSALAGKGARAVASIAHFGAGHGAGHRARVKC